MSTRERLDLASMVEDIEVSCEANGHKGFKPATWVVRQVQCCQRKNVGLSCDPCLQRYLKSPSVTCANCKTNRPGRDWIASWEPINLPAVGGV